jgi:hypothetical protein
VQRGTPESPHPAGGSWEPHFNLSKLCYASLAPPEVPCLVRGHSQSHAGDWGPHVWLRIRETWLCVISGR